jgi:excisionase family DNA binding protein
MIAGEIQPLMNPEEVARLLNVKPATVYQMARSGKLKPVELGIKSVRFRREDVEELMGARKAAA